MPVSKHSLRPEPVVRALWLALGLGWLLIPALAPISGDGEQDPVLVEAELRVSEQPPAPIAEVATSKAALRALSVRLRASSQQALATPVSLAAMLSPLRVRALAHADSIAPVREPRLRSARWHWPLPRSSCHADDEPSRA